MRKLSFFLVFISLFSFSQERVILKVMNAQKIAWNNGDIEGYMEGYWKNDSLVFIGAKGVTHGWNTTLTNYKKGYPTKEKMGKLDFTDVQIKPLGKKYALVIGKWYLERDEKSIGGIYSLVFQKFKNGWKIISDHTE